MQKCGVKWREKKGNSRRNWGNGRVGWREGEGGAEGTAGLCCRELGVLIQGLLTC